MDAMKLEFTNILDLTPREVRAHVGLWIVRTELGKTDSREFHYQLAAPEGVFERQQVSSLMTIIVMAAKLPTAPPEERKTETCGAPT